MNQFILFSCLWNTLLGLSTAVDIPGPPRNLTVSVINSRLIEVIWNQPEGNVIATQFKVTYSFYADGYNETKTLFINNTSTRHAQLTELYPHIVYNIKISEKGDAFGPSSEINVTTNIGVPQAAPEHIFFDHITSSSANISWTPIPKYLDGGNFTNYIFAISSNGDMIYFSKFPPTVTSVQVPGLMPNTTYTVIIATESFFGASSANIQKSFSTTLSAPSEPMNVAVESKSSTWIKLKWLPPAIPNNVKVYIISIVHFENGLLLLTVNVAANKTVVTISNLEPDTVYSITMRAANTELGNFTSPIIVKTDKSPKRNGGFLLPLSISLCLFIIILAVILVIFIRKYNCKKQKKNAELERLQPTSEIITKTEKHQPATLEMNAKLNSSDQDAETVCMLGEDTKPPIENPAFYYKKEDQHSQQKTEMDFNEGATAGTMQVIDSSKIGDDHESPVALEIPKEERTEEKKDLSEKTPLLV